MPSFHGLTDGERRLAVVAVKRFFPGFATTPPAPSFASRIPPPADDASVARGRELYAAAGCAACHGERGRGDGPSAATLRDADGLPIRAADLRYPARFKGGAEPVDLYRTLMSGLDGTPMPSYATALGDDPRAPWDLVAYVRSLRR